MGSNPVIPPPPPGFRIVGDAGGIPPPPPGFRLVGSADAVTPPEPEPTLGEFYRSGALGLLKSVGGSALGALPLGMGPGGPLGALIDRAMGGRLSAAAAPLVQPSNEAEAKAKKVGDVAQFLMPGMGEGGPILQGLKSMILSRSQGASPEGAALSGAVAGTGPLVGRALGATGRGLRSMAQRQYGRALGATTQGMKAESAASVPQLLDQRVSGSLKSLMQRAQGKRAATGAQIGATYRDAARRGVMSDTDAVLKSLDDIKEPFYATAANGAKIPANLPAISKVEEIQGVIKQFGPQAPPDQLWKVRRAIDDMVGSGFGRDLARGTAADIRRQARAAIQKELNKADPNIESLNATFGLWKGLEKITGATLRRQEGQSSGGALTTAVVSLARTPVWRTFSAVQKARIADLLLSGNSQGLASLIARLGAATTPPRDSEPQR